MSKNVTVGILGGTGALGRGLAYRWAAAGLDVVLGSRDPLRAQATAAEVQASAGAHTQVSGAGLIECATKADIVVIAVPWAAHDETLAEVAQAVGTKVLLNVVVPIEGGPGGIRAVRPEQGSVCALAQTIAPSARVVGGFHHVSFVKLQDTSLDSVDCDVLLVSDDDEALAAVAELVEAIPGTRAIHAGKILSAFAVEALTVNLIGMNKRYKTNAGVRITGIA